MSILEVRGIGTRKQPDHGQAVYAKAAGKPFTLRIESPPGPMNHSPDQSANPASARTSAALAPASLKARIARASSRLASRDP
ncbi:MAG: hypothetical protein GWN87_13570 [Desulfuromonadales bacterium]|nr:hypothetical protein [Desulfuromonadales bacterium]